MGQKHKTSQVEEVRRIIKTLEEIEARLSARGGLSPIFLQGFHTKLSWIKEELREIILNTNLPKK